MNELMIVLASFSPLGIYFAIQYALEPALIKSN